MTANTDATLSILEAHGATPTRTAAYRYWLQGTNAAAELDGLPDYQTIVLGTQLNDETLTELRRLFESTPGAIVKAGVNRYQRDDWHERPFAIAYLRVQLGRVEITAQGMRTVAQDAGEVSP